MPLPSFCSLNPAPDVLSPSLPAASEDCPSPPSRPETHKKSRSHGWRPLPEKPPRSPAWCRRPPGVPAGMPRAPKAPAFSSLHNKERMPHSAEWYALLWYPGPGKVRHRRQRPGRTQSFLSLCPPCPWGFLLQSVWHCRYGYQYKVEIS